MSEGKEKEIEVEEKQAEELSPEDLEKTTGGAFDTYLTFDPKGPKP
jgi:hypothetical protein